MSVNIRMYAVTVAIAFIFLVAVSSIDFKSASAADYEKSQTTVQTNECGNYWFPLDVLCSNLGSQVQGDENSVSVASAQQQEDVESNKNPGPPFP